MKKLLKIALLVSSLSLFAENALPKQVLPIANSDIIENNEIPAVLDKNSDESTIGNIINFLDNPDNIFVTGTAMMGILHVLDYIQTFAHEYGHAIPSIVTGNYYKIKINDDGSIIFPFSGSCASASPCRFLTVLLGPVAGLSTSYLQCAIIKALHDQHIQKKPFSETFKHALKFPITFFTNAMDTGEKYCSALLNDDEPWPSAQKKSSSFIVNTLVFFRMMDITYELITGFLPYDSEDDAKNDGEKIWEMILGKQPPTFKFDNMPRTILGIMAAPVALGAMKAIYKQAVKNYNNSKKAANTIKPVQTTMENNHE